MRALSLAAVLAVAALGALVPSAAAKSGSLTRADRNAINAALDAFVVHGVTRKNVARSFDVVTPELRAGMTRAEWVHGDIPAYPYPARGRTFHEWTLDYSEPNEVGLNLLLHPRRSASRRIGPIMFDVTLKRLHGRWLVDLFIPTATFAPEAGPSKVRAVPDYSPQPQGEGGNQDHGSRLSHAYAVIPFALLGLLVAALLASALVVWYRNRRFAASSTDLPPLPPRRSSIRPDDARTRAAYRP